MKRMAYLQTTSPPSSSSTSSTATYFPLTYPFRSGADGCVSGIEMTWNLREEGTCATGEVGGEMAGGVKGSGWERSRVRRRKRKSRFEVGNGVLSARTRPDQLLVLSTG